MLLGYSHPSHSKPGLSSDGFYLKRKEKDKILGQSRRLSFEKPSLYQIPTRNLYIDDKQRIRKCEFGFQGSKQLNEKVILIIGATGSGKSTLINGMINYILDVEWDDEFRFKLIEETAPGQKAKQAFSQTSWITAYTIHHRKGFRIPYNLTIIDTPGFGDTAGIMRDKEITKQIRKFFSTPGDKGIDHIDAVCFVMQSSLPRLTPTQKYIFDSVLALFGKNIKDNILMLFTFADGQKPPALCGLQEAKLSYKTYHKFNNSALFAKNNAADEWSNFDKMFWEMGIDGFKLFFHDSLMDVKPKSLLLTTETLTERHQIEVYIEGMQKNTGRFKQT